MTSQARARRLAPIVAQTIHTVYAMIETACRTGAISPRSEDFCKATGLSFTNRHDRDGIWEGIQQLKTSGRIKQNGIGNTSVFEIPGVGKTIMPARAHINDDHLLQKRIDQAIRDRTYHRKIAGQEREKKQLSLEVGEEVCIPSGHLMSEHRWRKLINASCEKIAAQTGRPLDRVGFREEVRPVDPYRCRLPTSTHGYAGSLVGCAAAMVAMP